MVTAARQQQRLSHASKVTASGLASGLSAPTRSLESEPEPGAAGATTKELLRRDSHRRPRLPPRAVVPSDADASDGEAQRSRNGTTALSAMVSALGELIDRLKVMAVSGRRPQDANECRPHSADSGLWATQASGDTTYGKFHILSNDPPGAALRLRLGLGGAEGVTGAACLGLGGVVGIKGAACGEQRPAPGAAGTATKKVTPLRRGGEKCRLRRRASASAVPPLRHTVLQVRRRGSRRSTAAKFGAAPTPHAKRTNKGKTERQVSKSLRSKRNALSENPFGAESSGEGVRSGVDSPTANLFNERDTEMTNMGKAKRQISKSLRSKSLRSKRAALSENPFGAKSSGGGVRSGVDSPTANLFQ